MQPKFKHFDEVSFTLKGVKIYAMVKESEYIEYHGNPTFIYDLFLTKPIMMDTIVTREVRCLEHDLTKEKFPLSALSEEFIILP